MKTFFDRLAAILFMILFVLVAVVGGCGRIGNGVPHSSRSLLPKDLSVVVSSSSILLRTEGAIVSSQELWIIPESSVLSLSFEGIPLAGVLAN